MKALCLYNPKAGKENLSRWQRDIQSSLGASITFYELKPEEIKRPPWKDQLEQYDSLIIMGGDGTVHHVVQHLVNRRIELFFIPAGTANDLCHNLGYRGELKTYLAALKHGISIPYDTIAMNGRHVITGGGFGLGCAVAHYCNELKNSPAGRLLKKIIGKNIYPVTLFIFGILNLSPLLKVQTNYHGKKRTYHSRALLIANQEFMGKSVRIAPGTRPDDGRFQFVRFVSPSSFKVLISLLKLKWNVPQSPSVHYRRELKTLDLEFSQPVPAYGDGELLPAAAHWKLTLHPESLKIRAPQQEPWTSKT